jgi:acetyltransferase-like isoleucine patch superfamily enzyme
MTVIRRIRRKIRRIPRRLGYVSGPRLMSALRKRWVLLRNPHATIVFGKHCYLGPGFSLHTPDEATFIAGPGVEFRRGFRAELAPNARVVIGGGCRFTYDVLIQCGKTIEIGERCNVGQSVMIVDGGHRFRDITRPLLEQGYDLRPIQIGDDVSITTKVTVIAGIGEHSFVGANSVVTREIPAYVLAVGVPARPIEYFGPEQERPSEMRKHESEAT